MRRTRPSLARAVCVTAALGFATALGAVPAAAAPVEAQATCPYPYVCFVKNGTIIGKFKDVTSTWQALPSKPSDVTVINTRNDDVAYIRNTNGGTVCIAPNRSFHTGWTLNAVRISSASSCG